MLGRMSTSVTFPNDPIAALWQAAHAWLAVVLRTFGAPTDIAALAGEACLALKRELRALHALVLKLLLIEAARLPPQHPPSRRAVPAVRSAAPRICHANETWRVRFSLRLPPMLKPRRRAILSRPRAARTPDPRALARACEALHRVLDDPMPAARRLARKLHALGACAAPPQRIALFRPRVLPREPMTHAHAIVRAHDCVGAFQDTG